MKEDCGPMSKGVARSNVHVTNCSLGFDFFTLYYKYFKESVEIYYQ